MDLPLQPKMIRAEGYGVEVHQVITADGYVLTMHRIIGRTGEVGGGSSVAKKPAVTGVKKFYHLSLKRVFQKGPRESRPALLLRRLGHGRAGQEPR